MAYITFEQKEQLGLSEKVLQVIETAFKNKANVSVEIRPVVSGPFDTSDITIRIQSKTPTADYEKKAETAVD